MGEDERRYGVMEQIKIKYDEECRECLALKNLEKASRELGEWKQMYYDVLKRLELAENHNNKLVKERFDRSDRF